MSVWDKSLAVLAVIVTVTVFYSPLATAAETLTVNATASYSGGPFDGSAATPPRQNYYLVFWLEDASGDFVRTWARWGKWYWYCLREWQGKSGYDVDAVSGATRDGYTLATSGPVDLASLPDGTYTVRLESTEWEDPAIGANNLSQFTFVKNGTASSQTLGTLGGFSNVSYSYTGRSAGNRRPGVTAGPDQWVTPSSGANLNGTVDDDGQPLSSPTTVWMKVSGPGRVTFGNPGLVDTSASFSVGGTYVLRLAAYDGALQTTDDVTVRVNSHVLVPTKDAEVNQNNDPPPLPPKNFPKINMMWVANDWRHREGYVRFDLAGTVTGTVTSATLRLAIGEFGNLTGDNLTRWVRDVADGGDGWPESTLWQNWGSRPATGADITSFVADYGWLEMDITSHVQDELGASRNGLASLNFYRKTQGTGWVIFETRESYTPPTLLVVTGTPSQPPVANAGSDVTVTDIDRNGFETVNVDGSGSFDPESGGLDCIWRENGIQLATGATPGALTFVVGTHTVEFEVMDPAGYTDTDTVIFTVNAPPTATISSPAGGSSFDEGTLVFFSGGATDAEDGTLSGGSLVWTSDVDALIGTGASFQTSTLSAGPHVITLTATDSDGGTATDTVGITMNVLNQPPSAAISQPAHGTTFTTADTITFSGSGTDPEDGALSGGWLVWTSGILGQIGTGASFGTSLALGVHVITLTATDSGGKTDTDTVTIGVTTPGNQAPTAAITSPSGGNSFVEGTAVSFTGSATDPEQGALTGSSLVWTSDLDGNIGTGASLQHSALSVGTHAITLMATDSASAIGVVSVNVTIQAAGSGGVRTGSGCVAGGGARFDVLSIAWALLGLLAARALRRPMVSRSVVVGSEQSSKRRGRPA